MSDTQDQGGGLGRADTPGTRWFVVGATLVLYACALGLCGVLVARGEANLATAGVLLVLTSAPIAISVFATGRGAGRQGPGSNAAAGGGISAGEGRALRAELVSLRESVDRLAAYAAMSDDARRALNREQEREILRGAIAEELAAGNAGAARGMVRTLEDRYGVRADARGLGGKAEPVRSVEGGGTEATSAVGAGASATDGASDLGARAQAAANVPMRTLPELMLSVEGLLHQRRWDDALLEANRAQGAFPDSPRAQALPERVRQSRLAFKAELERRFLLAAQEDRAEEALRVLAELDAYLTPEEAAPLREHARSVIGRARDSMGSQFRVAVQERRWGDAARLGDAIMQQFPNTRMAAEVRDVIEGVRQRAGEPIPAEG